MHDPNTRRYDIEIVERLLSPTKKLVALAIALELQVHVDRKGIVAGKTIDLDRVIDHQVDGNQRVDLLRIAAEAVHGAAHGGEVNDAGHAGKVLQNHARRLERDFDLRGRCRVPGRKVFDVLLR